MKLRPTLLLMICCGLAVSALFSAALAQTEPGSPSTVPSPVQPPGTTSTGAASGMPNDDAMMKMMMENARLNENHKLLASLDGTWNFTTKMWWDGNTSKKPQESKGTAVRKSIMGGRYSVMDVTGKMAMPGTDGKMKELEFKGQGIDGYDNAKQKFVGTWMDNMGTGIMMSEGTFDPATQTLNYTGEFQLSPEMKQQIRSVIKLTDKDHMTFEWYENRGGQELKTMEIDYTRAGKK